MEPYAVMTDENLPEPLPDPEITPESIVEPVAELSKEDLAVSGGEPKAKPIAQPAAEAVVEAGPVAEAAAKSAAEAEPADEATESFADLLSAFERSHAQKKDGGAKQLRGTVVSLTAEQVFLDIGYKTEGVLPRSAFENNAESVKAGDIFPVSVTGRNEEHYYELSRFKVAQPRDWPALQAAFASKTAIVGRVTAVVKGGLSVDVGVRAFMPASRSGTRDAAEMEKLVGADINCRITKLDVQEEDVVVDRRAVLEEQARGLAEAQRAALKEGDTVSGTVRTLMPYGAFVDIGGVDGLLHVSDIAHSRVSKPEEVLTVGQELQLRILKIDPETKKISLGLKQLQPEPWQTVPDRLQAGQRISGTVTRLAEFGAFVEIEPGVEGLIHISQMSWSKRMRHPSDLLKQGERVDAVILGIQPEGRRISLGLKQSLADPWLEVPRSFPAGSQIEGPVTKLMNFGAFVELAPGVEGLVHVSEISAEKRIHHPQDVLRVGQRVKAQVLAVDAEKRQIKLSMKQAVPTSMDEYIAEHKAGDRVSGRLVAVSAGGIQVELGEGIFGTCGAAFAPSAPAATPASDAAPKLDLSSLSSMLKDRWKGNAPAPSARPEPLAEGQVRSFRIKKLDVEAKKIELELA